MSAETANNKSHTDIDSTIKVWALLFYLSIFVSFYLSVKGRIILNKIVRNQLGRDYDPPNVLFSFSIPSLSVSLFCACRSTTTRCDAHDAPTLFRLYVSFGV